MGDYTRSSQVHIDAAVHEVFQHCRNPRHLFEGWPELEVTDVVITPRGVGTKAHITGKLAKGLIVDQVEREYTEFVDDERIVTTAHGTRRLAGLSKPVTNAPVFTWLFESSEGGTTVNLVFSEDLGWLQSLFMSVSDAFGQALVAKRLKRMLAAIKTSVERQASPAV